MRKFMIVAAVVFCAALSSCGNGNSEAEATNVDSVVVDTVMVDTMGVDTVVVDTLTTDSL